jgi:hypothetical protein
MDHQLSGSKNIKLKVDLRRSNHRKVVAFAISLLTSPCNYTANILVLIYVVDVEHSTTVHNGGEELHARKLFNFLIIRLYDASTALTDSSLIAMLC